MKSCFILRPCPKFNVGISKHTVQLLQSCTSVLEFEVLAQAGRNICFPAEPPLPFPLSPPALLLDSMNNECKNHSQRTHTHHSLVHYHGHIWRGFTYPIIRNAIIVVIIVTSISNAILIVIFLPRVREVGAVVLNNRKTWSDTRRL